MVRPRSGKPCFLALESLERRDCPAVVAVFGGGTIAEGGDSTVLTVRLSAPAAKPVQVGYIIGGDGATPADYRLVIGTRILSAPSGTIEFRPGETQKQVRVSAVDDAAREGNESFRFALFRPAGCTIDAVNARADVTVRDNDDYTAALVPQGPSRVDEGAAAPFVIQLTKPATRAETFYVSTQDGTATTADYRPLRDMPVTILAGQQRSQPFSLNTVTDSNNTETDEYFLVTARARSADMPAIESVGVTIRGTGPAPISVVVTNPSIVEGNTGTSACTFTVTLSAPALDPIVVQYRTVDGTATGGVDYVAASGSLTFSRGQISKTVTVNVIGDTNVEENETFRLLATASSGGASVSATGISTIQNDDSGFEITLVFVDTALGIVPPQVRRIAEEAAARWSRIIVGDLPDVPAGGTVIDDLRMTIQWGVLGNAQNGAAGPLANARPTAFRDNGQGIPYAGETGLNPFYTTWNTEAQRLQVLDTITHEMGHALGYTPGAQVYARWIDRQKSLFIGPNALNEYRAIFVQPNAPGVPLDATTAHWSEEVFDAELMSPIAESGREYISRVTIGALQDMGYSVNYAAAEPYVRPAGRVPSSFSASVVPRDGRWMRTYAFSSLIWPQNDVAYRDSVVGERSARGPRAQSRLS